MVYAKHSSFLCDLGQAINLSGSVPCSRPSHVKNEQLDQMRKCVWMGSHDSEIEAVGS